MVVKVDKVINCTVIGDAMTGKSTLVKTFIDTIIPDDNYAATILETYEGMYRVQDNSLQSGKAGIIKLYCTIKIKKKHNTVR